jgi:hypothetical protein
MIGGSKLSSFKIEGPKLQKVKNRGTKTAIKPNFNLFAIGCSYFYSTIGYSSIKL